MAQLLIWGNSREILTGRVTTGPTEEVHTLGALKAALDGKGAALVLADVERLEAEHQAVEEWWEDGGGKSQVVFVAVSDARDSDDILERFSFLDDVISRPVTPGRLKRKVERALDAIRNRRVMSQLEVTLMRRGDELSELNKIGVALSAEREIDTLLELVLEKSRWVTGADAGSLYIVEPSPEDSEAEAAHLRFRLAQNDSLDFPFQKQSRPIDKSWIAGYVAHTGEPVRIDNAYNIPADAPYRISRSFDQKSGYRTKSLLVVPMRNHMDEVIGVVQLINKKRDPSTVLKPLAMMERIVEDAVIPFTSSDEGLASSLASQAAVAYQNAELLKNIRGLFEEFVDAAVTAVEMRDPTTSGHSKRVAVLTVGLAECVGRLSSGPLASVRLGDDELEELRYASILHDFGKVAVPEKVLKKGKKLLGSELKAIELRFAYRARTLEVEHLRRKAEAIDSQRLSAEELAVLDAEYAERRRELKQVLDAVRLANEPRLVEEKGIEALEDVFAVLRAVPVRTFDHQEQEQDLPAEQWASGPLLSERERDALLIPRGSLTKEEREDDQWGINSHVQHTYEFLRKIPWTGEYRRIPEIAWAHHEKLDGSGYPRRLEGREQIKVQSRMMTVSDIFDALRAWDRPYKRAVSPERALDILADDVKKGRVDGDLLEVFVESRIWDTSDYLEELANPTLRTRPGRR
jgi:HD-GYP domain-containing protein (c-di-GMP phosphodiesterase class II)